MGNALDFDIYLDSFLCAEWTLGFYIQTRKTQRDTATMKAKTIAWALDHKGSMSEAEALAKVEELRAKYNRVHANEEPDHLCDLMVRLFLKN